MTLGVTLLPFAAFCLSPHLKGAEALASQGAGCDPPLWEALVYETEHQTSPYFTNGTYKGYCFTKVQLDDSCRIFQEELSLKKRNKKNQ